MGHLVTLFFKKKKNSIFLIKRKLKGNFVFLGVLTARIEEWSKLTAIESSRVQIKKF